MPTRGNELLAFLFKWTTIFDRDKLLLSSINGESANPQVRTLANSIRVGHLTFEYYYDPDIDHESMRSILKRKIYSFLQIGKPLANYYQHVIPEFELSFSMGLKPFDVIHVCPHNFVKYSMYHIKKNNQEYFICKLILLKYKFNLNYDQKVKLFESLTELLSLIMEYLTDSLDIEYVNKRLERFWQDYNMRFTSPVQSREQIRIIESNFIKRSEEEVLTYLNDLNSITKDRRLPIAIRSSANLNQEEKLKANGYFVSDF